MTEAVPPSSDPSPAAPPATAGLAGRALNLIETIGNKLPDPVTLFVIGALLVPVISQLLYQSGWEVAKIAPQTIDGQLVLAETDEKLRAVPMLTSDNLYGLLKGMVQNFIEFPPLGVVLAGMLGIGVAERSGLVGALLKACMLITPKKLLTPMMLFLGVMSSAGSDAGYVVLPPVAALLYLSVGRSPLAGIAAVFAGVSAGFCANLAITVLDPILAEFSTDAARIVDSSYTVDPQGNWWFAAASAVFLTFIGWGVTAWYVEPRLNARAPEHGGPGQLPDADDDAHALTAADKKGLAYAGAAAAVFAALVALLIGVEGAVLYGAEPGGEAIRWVKTIVPLLLLAFLLPAIVFGLAAGTIKNDKDVARMMTEAMAAMAPIIVLAFFAGQFIAWFEDSNLGAMFAITGGLAIAESGLPTWAVLVGFILLVCFINLFIGSMSAKYTLLAPVFIPMFMIGAGMSPELTQAAYRVGDSCTNIITPLNAYLIIILVFVQKYDKHAGMGTMIALMLPYSVVFLVTWTAMLLAWVSFGVPLGPEGPLEYVAPAGG